MTRRDYELIASAIAAAAPAPGMPLAWSQGCAAACEAIAWHLADALALDHPRFDRHRFMVAAGVDN